MTRRKRGLRHGGLSEFEQRVLDGDVMAMRALVRQASGPNTLDLAFDDRVEVKAKPDGTGGSRLLFTGYASLVDAPYEMADWAGDYVEVVRAGAFRQTLAMQPDVVFCLNHRWGDAPLARTTAGTHRLAEDSTGLAVEADLDPKRSDVYAVQSCIEAGELDAMSFAFYVVRQQWSPDYAQRDILELDLDGGDTSVVTHPASPHTAGTVGLRSRAARSLLRSRVPGLIVERARAEARAGKSLSSATMTTLQAVLELVAEADEATDTAAALLSELMGVDNPCADDADESDDAATETDPAETESKSTGDDLAIEAARRERLALAAARRR